MNTGTIGEIAKGAGDGTVSMTTVVLIIFLVGWLTERIIKITRQKVTTNGNPTWSNFRKELDKKVNNEDCKEFRTRIGGESDEHRRNINEIKSDVSEIKSGISYIKGKLENK